MSPFLDAVLKLALIGFVIKFLWDGLVIAPQEKFQAQIDFLIDIYCNKIQERVDAIENVENEIRVLESAFHHHSELPDEKKEVLKKVHKTLVKSIEKEY